MAALRTKRHLGGQIPPGPASAVGAYCIVPARMSSIIRTWEEKEGKERKKSVNKWNMEREVAEGSGGEVHGDGTRGGNREET